MELVYVNSKLIIFKLEFFSFNNFANVSIPSSSLLNSVLKIINSNISFTSIILCFYIKFFTIGMITVIFGMKFDLVDILKRNRYYNH